MRIILLHMVSSTIKENCALVGCHNVLYVYSAGMRGGGVYLGRCMSVRVCVAGEWVYVLVEKRWYLPRCCG